MSTETPEPAQAYYEKHGWSGRAGSGWDRMTEAHRDAWRHAERVARRLAERNALLGAAERILTDFAARDADNAAHQAERDRLLDLYHLARASAIRRGERLREARAERDRFRAAVAALADWSASGVDRLIPSSELRAVLNQHPGPDDTREGA